MIRLYVEGSEPGTNTSDERKVLLNHRLDSLIYWQKQLADGKMSYAFRSKEGDAYHLLLKADSLEDADAALKADPAWFFSNHNVVPVTTTKSMLNEIFQSVPQERFAALGIAQEQHTFSAQDMTALDNDQTAIDPDGMYTLAAKGMQPMAVTTSSAEQDQIWSKTIASQRMHLNDVELVDHNPVGRAEGLLIGKGSPDDVKAHVSAAPIYPHTVVNYTPLMTLKQAWVRTNGELVAMGEAERRTDVF